MGSAGIVAAKSPKEWSDEEVVARVLAGESQLYEILMRRYNQRLFRVSVAILHDQSEAEDVMQDAYVRAYQHLADFEGRAKFSTWLTRIAVHEALARTRRRSRFQPVRDFEDASGDAMKPLASAGPDPEQQASTRELSELLEKAILGLPEDYRLILMMRHVEEMNTEETAECLNVTEENVRVRLHRARALLRKQLYSQVGSASIGAFLFLGARCDRMVTRVFRTLGFSEPLKALP